MQEHVQGHSDLTKPMVDVISGWAKRLLQLDGRNSLLYYKPGRSGVKIVNTHPDQVSDRLMSTRKGLTFDHVNVTPELQEPFPVTVEAIKSIGEQQKDTEPSVIFGDLKSDISPVVLQRRLGTLTRRAREWEQEQGLKVLFLALGFLEWIDDRGRTANSPLVLMPVALDRASPRDPYTLYSTDDSLENNGTLRVKLERDFGIHLPVFDDNESPETYLSQVSELVEQNPNLLVTSHMYLATFAYSKIAMVNDCRTSATLGHLGTWY